MRKTMVLAVLLCACGGVEGSVGDGGGTDVATGNDGGTSGMDVSTGMDTGPGDDSGMDSGGMDGGGMDVMGPFTPGSLSCLVLWLDAAKGVTQNNNFVSKWADQSGKMNDANQMVMARMPTLAANAINNLPAIHFNQGQNQQGSVGNQLVVNDSMSMRWGTGDFILWFVARYNNIPNAGFAIANGLFFSKQPLTQQGGPGVLVTANFFNFQQTASTGFLGAVDSTPANVLAQTAPYNDNMPRVYSFRRAGTTLELRVNAMTLATKQQTGMVNVDSMPNNVRIGADGDASFRRLNGDIAEIVGCAGMSTMQDVANVDAYLKSKYNL